MTRILSLICVGITISASSQSLPTNFIIGKTTGPLAFIEYGLGEDRLGGAKIGYLDSNIVIKIVDSVKDRYKIQLSKNHFCYLPKSNFKFDSTVTSPPLLSQQ